MALHNMVPDKKRLVVDHGFGSRRAIPGFGHELHADDNRVPQLKPLPPSVFSWQLALNAAGLKALAATTGVLTGRKKQAQETR